MKAFNVNVRAIFDIDVVAKDGKEAMELARTEVREFLEDSGFDNISVTPNFYADDN